MTDSEHSNEESSDEGGLFGAMTVEEHHAQMRLLKKEFEAVKRRKLEEDLKGIDRIIKTIKDGSHAKFSKEAEVITEEYQKALALIDHRRQFAVEAAEVALTGAKILAESTCKENIALLKSRMREEYDGMRRAAALRRLMPDQDLSLKKDKLTDSAQEDKRPSRQSRRAAAVEHAIQQMMEQDEEVPEPDPPMEDQLSNHQGTARRRAADEAALDTEPAPRKRNRTQTNVRDGPPVVYMLSREHINQDMKKFAQSVPHVLSSTRTKVTRPV